MTQQQEKKVVDAEASPRRRVGVQGEGWEEGERGGDRGLAALHFPFPYAPTTHPPTAVFCKHSWKGWRRLKSSCPAPSFCAPLYLNLAPFSCPGPLPFPQHPLQRLCKAQQGSGCKVSRFDCVSPTHPPLPSSFTHSWRSWRKLRSSCWPARRTWRRSRPSRCVCGKCGSRCGKCGRSEGGPASWHWPCMDAEERGRRWLCAACSCAPSRGAGLKQILLRLLPFTLTLLTNSPFPPHPLPSTSLPTPVHSLLCLLFAAALKHGVEIKRLRLKLLPLIGA